MVNEREAELLAEVLRETVFSGNRIFLGGNGGSWANCAHFCADLGTPMGACHAGWPIQTLGAEAAVLTALANDGSFSRALAREASAKVMCGDLVLALSTSGSSPNLVDLLRTARSRGAVCGLVTRENPSRVPDGVEFVFRVGVGDAANVELEHLRFLTAVSGQVARRHRITEAGRPALFAWAGGPETKRVRGSLPVGLFDVLEYAQDLGLALFLLYNAPPPPRSGGERERNTPLRLHADLFAHRIRPDEFRYCGPELESKDTSCLAAEEIVGDLCELWGVDKQRSIALLGRTNQVSLLGIQVGECSWGHGSGSRQTKPFVQVLARLRELVS